MTKCLSTFDIWLRVVCGVLAGIIVGALAMLLINFLYTEGYEYDKAVKEFKTEVLHINEAWEVNVYPDAKFDVVTSGIEKDVPLTQERKK
jgi:hypothetical protein